MLRQAFSVNVRTLAVHTRPSMVKKAGPALHGVYGYFRKKNDPSAPGTVRAPSQGGCGGFSCALRSRGRAGWTQAAPHEEILNTKQCPKH